MAHPVDLHVGSRIRQRRQLFGMTQQQLADRIGTVAQQVQKYEIAANRVSAGRLFDIARALDTDAETFFEGLGGGRPGAPDPSQAAAIDRLLETREAQQFLRTCHAVPSAQRRQLLSLVSALGAGG